MKYISVCSGIEAATVAWHPLGWEPLWLSEIEKFPSAVLAHHYPDIPNRGDMTNFKEWPDEPVGLLAGGTPCQSFSVAGLRKGLDDPRGNLMLTYLAIAKRYRPQWLVWENVPGVLSSGGGRDFGTFLGALGELGYGWSYRVLDAQFFGIPQRRRRVFVVGHLGNWQPAAAVLFERESLQRNPAPSREAKQNVAGTVTARIGRSRGAGCPPEMTTPCWWDGGQTSQTLDAVLHKGQTMPEKNRFPAILEPMCFESRIARNGRGAPDTVVPPLKAQSGETGKGDAAPLIFQSYASATNSMNPGRVSPTLDKGKGDGVAVAFAQNSRDEVRLQGGDGGICGALSANEGMKQRTYIAGSMVVRRLTPVECERLQGFPDNWTRIAWRGKQAEQCPDGPRYKATGNSMAVPVMHWIGERIQIVEDILNERVSEKDSATGAG